MAQDSEPAETRDRKSEATRPFIYFDSLTFSDGNTLVLEPDDIVVFVGPNNAGKSLTLRELHEWVGTNHFPHSLVVKGTTLQARGNPDDLRAYLEVKSEKVGNGPDFRYAGMGYDIHNQHVSAFGNDGNRNIFANLFARRLDTGSRLSDSNSGPGHALFRAPPTHPIHDLLMYPDLATEISAKFRRAFGFDLTPFRGGGNSFPLYVGEKPKIPPGKDELSEEFIRSLLNSNIVLEQQGDGMRSFVSVLLNVLVAQTHSIHFLDEPEAFLHPPQARLLGRYIAESKATESQLFISTHSIDILDGLLEGGSNRVRIVRIRRDGNINRVKELSKAETTAVAKDTLARFSRVFDGIFFEHVFICEADADCMFYQSLLNLPNICGDRQPDVLFIHTAGKHRLAQLAQTLRSLDVPVSVIADIDVLNDESVFKNLFEKLGGDWDKIRVQWKTISDAVINERPPLTAQQITDSIQALLKDVGGTDAFPKAAERGIKKIFASVSPGSAVKRNGTSAFPPGQPTQQLNALLAQCDAHRLWIVPVGEVEGFCRSMGDHGPGFVERVLEERDLATDPELEAARSFMKKIWSSVTSTTQSLRYPELPSAAASAGTGSAAE